jgi:cyclophilin family peptidyl-prolyl cis-trans isomerase/protein-disulfide isomerase
MRKLALFVMVMALFAAGMTGCSGSTPDPTVTETAAPSPTVVAQATAVPQPQNPTPAASSGPATCVAEPFIFEEESRIPPVTEADHVVGPADAAITFIEYADFQCPACAALTGLREYLMEQYEGDIRFVYRHLPLISIHDKAVITAEASEAAAAQGKFWEMYDLLYQRQQQWNALTEDALIEQLVGYADELALDVEQFEQELTDHIYQERILADYEAYGQYGPMATPTFVINGTFYPTQALGGFGMLESFISVLQIKDRLYTAPPPQVIDPEKEYIATIRTEHGDIVVELFADLAPVNVNSFVFLAQEGWYDGVTFHRVIPDFVAQGGDPSGSGMGSPGYRCDDEIAPELTYDEVGMLGMASGGPGTSSIGSQFFITYAPLPQLTGNYTIIGKVIEGMDVAEQITPRDPSQGTGPLIGDVIETILIEEQ